MMQAQDERADLFIAAAAVDSDQVLHGEGKLILAGIVRVELFVQRFAGELAGLAFVEDGELRVEAEFVEMLAHEAQAKTVERADVRDVEERKLTRPVVVVGRGGTIGCPPIFGRAPAPLPSLRLLDIFTPGAIAPMAAPAPRPIAIMPPAMAAFPAIPPSAEPVSFDAWASSDR